MVNYAYERTCWKLGADLVAGVDEAGRGPLAGPVVAAAVIFPSEVWIHGVDDSKKLTPARREELCAMVREAALCVGVGIVSHEVVDEINVYRAAMRAMGEAVAALRPQPKHLLVDGPRYHDTRIPFNAIVGGDATCFSIAAASIVAKVTRDEIMRDYDARYPGYGFAQHKGYGTKAHREAIQRLGPCPIHRRSFRLG
jgi:ribonuclease HII